MMKSNVFHKSKDQFGLIGIIVCLGIVFTAFNHTFIASENLLNIVRQSAVNIIVAMGATFVMISGEIDLSLGGVACLTGMVISSLMASGTSVPLAILAGLCVGAAIGFINGFLTTKFQLNSMIVTLATFTFANGAASLITGGTAIYGLPASFGSLGNGYLAFIPVQVIFMIVLVVISAVLLNKTLIGRYAKAIGGNKSVARLAGIAVNRYKILFFVICGVLSSFGGMILTSRLMCGQPNLGSNMVMDILTAVVIGGTAMSGGEGSIIGSVLGALLLTVISNGLTINGVNSFWQQIITAIILILTIIVRREKSN